MKTVHVLRRLTPLDRCDRCTGRASIAIMFTWLADGRAQSGELMFCPEHYEMFGERLMASHGLITGLDEFVPDGRPI